MKTEPFSQSPSVDPIFTFNATVLDKSSGQAGKGIVSGLTLDGCLFQSPLPFPIGTILRLQFLLTGHPVEVSAIVRHASPVGSMQLEFFALDSAESLRCLQNWLTSNSLVPQTPDK